MPRNPRLAEAGYLHHIIVRGNDRQSIYREDDDFRVYLSFVEQARQQFPVKIYNFVLMDNHIHLLVEPTEEGALSKFMHAITRQYANYFNKKYDRTGHVFEGRYKNYVVQSEKYFFSCSRYIDLNPVRAHLSDAPQKYAWSGYAALAEGGKSAIELDKHEMYQALGKSEHERQIAYRALINYYPGEEIDLMNLRGNVVGDRNFKETVQSKAKKPRIKA